MPDHLVQRRNALFAFFFAPGMALASWVTRTPEIRDAVAASVAQMGLILFGMSIGSMAGILCSGRIVARIGTRKTALMGLTLVVASLLVMALGSGVGLQWGVSLGLALFGLGMGSCEIAINMDGAEVERQSNRHLLHTLHGCFSLGTLIGALIGLAMVWGEIPVVWHLSGMAFLLVAVVFWHRNGMPADYGVRSLSAEVRSVATKSPWRDLRILLIGAIVFAMALAEGAANDWLPILVVDGHGFSQTAGSLIFVAFAAAMTAGRFGGGVFLARYGAAPVLRVCAVMSAIGIAYVAFGTEPWLVGLAVFLWGAGCALGFPVALSAAGQGSADPAPRVEAVAIIGYIAMLVGPPSLGLIGEHHGLRGAMALVLLLVAIAVLLAPVLRPRQL